LAINLEYRKARASDVGTLVDLRIEFMRIVKDGAFPDEEEWRAELSARFASDIASGEFVAWICLEGARVVATSGLAYPVPADTRAVLGLGPGEALLCNMYTIPDYRRKGLATELLERSMAEAAAKGASAIRLQATDDSRALYASRGFAVSGEDMLLVLTGEDLHELRAELETFVF
jgi:GNAT superfamily N-acetyltransferase